MQETGVAIRDEAISFFEGSFAEKFKAVPQTIMTLNEMELEEFFTPTTTDLLIRKNLWKVVNQHRDAGLNIKIDTAELYRGVCTKGHFYSQLLNNQYRVSWWLIPVDSYQTIVEDGTYHFFKKAREVMVRMQVTEKNFGHFVTLGKLLADRSSLGPVTQRVEQKSVNVNVTANERGVVDMGDQSLVQDRLKELKTKLVTAPESDDNEPT